MRARILAVMLVAGGLMLGFASLEPSAERLPTFVRPSHYDLAFDVDLVRASFKGTETIAIQIDRPTSRIVLNAVDITFEQVTVRVGTTRQTAVVTLDQAAQTATLTVSRTLPAGTATLDIRFSGILNNDLRGFYLSQANGRNYAITQFESSDARRAFPCFDDPSLKATFAVQVTVDRGDTVISNGRLLRDAPGPGGGRHTLTFDTSPKMSSYLVAMAVGDFQCLEDTAENIPLRVCATPNKKELGQIALDWGKQILTFYNAYYAIKYPFGKLDMVAVPDFAAGAMENTAAIFYRETDLLADSKTASQLTRKNIASVIAHEIAHQWFGNLVTMKWWDDLWLNEGFATWMANRPLAAAQPEWNIAVDEVAERRSALTLDALTTTRAIHSSVETPDQIEESFDVIAYEKGGAVMRMMEAYVGPELFRKGINAYLEKYAYGNATSEDFWTVIAATSGKPVDRILPTFVNQPGAPLVEVSLECRNGGTQLSLRQSRFSVADSTSGAPPVRAWQIPICVKTPGQPAAACHVLGGAAETVTLGTSCQPWAFVNAGAQGYYRAAYAPELLRALAPDLQTRLTAAERASLADDEWALVRAGRHTVGDFLTLAGGFSGEHTSATLAQITDQLEFIRDSIVTDSTRPRFAAWVRTLLTPLFTELGLSAATPGESDDRRALRGVVIEALGGIGDDPTVMAGARGALEGALSASTPLEPATAGAIVNVAARRGDRALFEALLAAAAKTRVPDEHYRYLYALAAFEDPALSQRALEYSISPDLRRQDTSQYLARFLGNPMVNTRAWAFVKAHWADLQPKLAGFGATRVVAALGSFCTTDAREDVKAFFASNTLPGVSRTIDQAVERMNNCIAIREKQSPVLAQWLSQ